MSAGSIPYHLRQNKAIERNLFIELLTHLNRFRPISDYTYVGFGGPYLEDFKLIHSSFSNVGMISLEKEDYVLRRQKFNLPYDVDCIKCIPLTSGEFIDTYDIDGNALIWLDYASPKYLGDQIREYHTVITKLRAFDVLKITLNANPVSLANPQGSTAEAKRQARYEELKRRLGGVIPSDIKVGWMEYNSFPLALLSILRNTASAAMRGRTGEIFKPLTAFAYADSAHQMMTLTAIILPSSEEERFFRETAIKSWKFANTEWKKPETIQVPELTIRERNFIDSRLPGKNETDIFREMMVSFDEKESVSLNLLKNYIRYYRQFPYFSKIVI